jgi:hypothetical protein
MRVEREAQTLDASRPKRPLNALLSGQKDLNTIETERKLSGTCSLNARAALDLAAAAEWVMPHILHHMEFNHVRS